VRRGEIQSAIALKCMVLAVGGVGMLGTPPMLPLFNIVASLISVAATAALTWWLWRSRRP
jgi:hypothetical protein